MRLSTEQSLKPAADDSDDYALMAGLRNRDPEAMTALYNRFSGLVYGLCQRALRDTRDSEDLLVDVFAEIWERADRYDPARGSPYGYIMGLARSRAVDRLRSRRSAAGAGMRAAVDADAASHIAGDGIGPLAEAMNIEQRAKVITALNSLSADQRQALELAFFEGLSHAEVAERLGQPLGTIKSRIRQSLSQLRNLLCSAD